MLKCYQNLLSGSIGCPILEQGGFVMISYRKLAMRILGRPFTFLGGGYKSNPSPAPAGRRTDSYRCPAYRGGLPRLCGYLLY